MKLFWIILLLPFICSGQQSEYIQRVKRWAAAKEVNLKAGQEGNLKRVVCILDSDEWGGGNAAAESKIESDKGTIIFPVFGTVYSVLKKTNDGFYELLELTGKTMWDSHGFIVLDAIEYL